jgi:sugar diacid utilization regulator
LRGESSKNPSWQEQIGEVFLFELIEQDKQKEELNSQAKH